MSAFGGKADMTLRGNPLSRSLSGVKRTWLFALPEVYIVGNATTGCTTQRGYQRQLRFSAERIAK
jgi:hypothetical protein